MYELLWIFKITYHCAQQTLKILLKPVRWHNLFQINETGGCLSQYTHDFSYVAGMQN